MNLGGRPFMRGQAYPKEGREDGFLEGWVEYASLSVYDSFTTLSGVEYRPKQFPIS